MSKARSRQLSSFPRLALFASGDFACNLYWQSVTLFLFFYCTDVLELPPAEAGLIAMAGALCDGGADLVVGILARRRTSRYRRFVLLGSLPLGVSFALMYALPLLPGGAGLGVVLIAQLLFRSLYAVVNVPYAAWSTRISDDSRDRAVIAGLRMLFGTLAAITVALATPWMAALLTRGPSSAAGFLAAAIAFAAVATPLLVLVAATAREAAPPMSRRDEPSVATSFVALARNRAFVTLNAASAAAAVAAAFVNQSVLYYFKHVAADAPRGPHALAMMSIAGAAAVPMWMVVTSRFGVRAAWIAASAIGLACLAAFALARDDRGAELFLMAIQIVFVAFNLGLWAMLPDTVEYGERRDGIRVEAMAFGVSALFQRAALALAAALMGMAYGRIGYAADAPLATGTIDAIKALMLYVPAAALGVSLLAMIANPLRRGVHAAIVAELARRRAAPGRSEATRPAG